MDISAAVVSGAQAPEAMQPGEGPLDGPAELAQAAAMRGVAAGKQRANAASAQFVAVRLRVVGSIPLHEIGSRTRPSRLACDRRDFVHQRDQLSDVVAIGSGDLARERHTLSVGDQVVFAARPPAIRGIGAGFCPAPTARTLELSTSARDQSSASAPCKPSSSSRCNCSHTPAWCQSRSRRQHVIPQPHPIS